MDIPQICRMTGKSFIVTDGEQALLSKLGLPLPTLCIEERHRRRLSHRNERKLYQGTCHLTKKPIISIYSPDQPYTIYSSDAWYSDAWDPRDYGREMDFSRPFLEQFFELKKSVPRLALMNLRGENSDYCNITNSNKNCYLVFGGDYSEDCLYSIFSMHCKDACDVYLVNASELVYDSMDCSGSYRLRYSQNSVGCRESDFLLDCRNCANCFGCVGLINKEYHIFNKPYSPQEYHRIVKSYRLDTWSGVQRMKQAFDQFKQQFPHRFARILNSEQVTGDFISNAKNCFNCFDVEGPAEDCKDLILGGWGAKDLLSSDHCGFKAELYYEMLGSIEGRECALSAFSWTCQNTFYCDMVINSHDLFGCSGMKRAEYCILNKPYSKEDYLKLRAQIIEHMKCTGEWGEFPSMKQSLFAYNETVAQDFFPLTKDEVMARGLRWKEEGIQPISKAVSLPDSIHEVNESILSEALVCEKTGRPYRLIPQELRFYQKMEIPLPRYAPETRHQGRIAQRNPHHLWDRSCSRCGGSLETTYAPDRPEKILCEACYLKEVY